MIEVSSSKSCVPEEVIDLVVATGIDQKYPVYLGQTIKTMLQSTDSFEVSPHTFKTFVLFLERCKGYEEDAKRFVSLAHDTDHIQVDYDMLQPLFLRTIKHKSGNEVLKLFEQFRKTLRLNRSHNKTDPGEKSKNLKAIKINFYDGLVKDLMEATAYSLSQVIQSEKAREKFEPNVRDELVALEIFASQHKLEEFRTIYKDLIVDEKSGVKYTLD